MRLSTHTIHTHFQQFIWFKTTRDSVWREVGYTREQTCIFPNRCSDRHGVSGVLPTIRFNWHDQYFSHEQPVTDTSLEEVGEEKSAEDTRSTSGCRCRSSCRRTGRPHRYPRDLLLLHQRRKLQCYLRAFCAQPLEARSRVEAHKRAPIGARWPGRSTASSEATEWLPDTI